MRILFVHQAFYPDPAGAARVLYELAMELSARGHEITVVTGNRAYSTGERLVSTESFGRVVVKRIPVVGSRGSPAGRALSMLWFTVGALLQLRRLARTHDVVVVSTLPPFLASPATRLVKRWRKAFVYLCHDIYPDILASNGHMRGLIGKVLWRLLERHTVSALRRSTKVIVLSASMRQAVIRKAPEVNGRVEIIPNFADPKRIRPVPRENPWSIRHGLARKRVVLYAGNMGPSHNLELLLKAAKASTDPDVVFVFVGSGAKRAHLEEAAKAMGLVNVRFFPFQPDEILSEVLGTALVSVVALEPELEGLAVPSKLYSIMASARPVLVLQPHDRELAQMVEGLGIGLAASTVGEVLDAIRKLSDEQTWKRLSERAYGVFLERYSVETVCDAYERVFAEALAECSAY